MYSSFDEQVIERMVLYVQPRAGNEQPSAMNDFSNFAYSLSKSNHSL